MRLKNSKNKIIIPLLLVVFIIWGIILFRAIDYFKTYNKSEDISTLADNVPKGLKTKNDLPVNPRISYIKLKRDPFMIAVKKTEPVVRKVSALKKNTSVPVPKLNYRINGIIINEKNRLVIFEDLTNNKIVFLRENDKYASIIVKKIDMDTVALYDNHKIKKIIPGNNTN